MKAKIWILGLLFGILPFYSCNDDEAEATEESSITNNNPFRVKRITGETQAWGAYELQFHYRPDGLLERVWRFGNIPYTETRDTMGTFEIEYDLNEHDFKVIDYVVTIKQDSADNLKVLYPETYADTIKSMLKERTLYSTSLKDGSYKKTTCRPPLSVFGDYINLTGQTQMVENGADGKPLIHVGDGTTGVGCALRVADGRPTLAGTWGNGVWGGCNVFPPADALDGEGSVCVAFTTGTRPVRMTVFPCEGGTPAWTAVTGLQGTGLGADRICFGNFVGATAGGLDFTLERVAVFRGEASDAAIVAFARDGMARCGAGAVCTRFDAARTRLGLDTGALALAPVGSRAVLTLPEDGAADWEAVWEALVDWSEACPPALTLSVSGNRLLATVRRTEANLTVLPMGDSITHGSSNGANWRRTLFDGFAADAWSVRSAGFWENLYSDALAAANAPALPECRRHNGISGQRIHTGGNRAGYLEGVANFLDAAGHPDVITLLIGTNDAGGDPATAFAQWRALVRRLVALRPDAWVIVSPIIATRGQTEEDYKADAFRPAYNEAILSLFDVSERTVEADGAAVPCVLGVPNAAGRAASPLTAAPTCRRGFSYTAAAPPWPLAPRWPSGGILHP